MAPPKGFKHTDMAKLKISVAGLGLKRTEKTKINLSNSKKEDKNPQWKGGVSEDYYRRIRREIKPDICELCGKSDGQINTHHKDGNHYNNGLNNLIVLCNKCHANLHKLERYNADR